jgi:hypothetical protein
MRKSAGLEAKNLHRWTKGRLPATRLLTIPTLAAQEKGDERTEVKRNNSIVPKEPPIALVRSVSGVGPSLIHPSCKAGPRTPPSWSVKNMKTCACTSTTRKLLMKTPGVRNACKQ